MMPLHLLTFLNVDRHLEREASIYRSAGFCDALPSLTYIASMEISTIRPDESYDCLFLITSMGFFVSVYHFKA